ncbi:MAG: hypothetical protein CM1200mP24_00840 [Gammaproteobacteria bacterium]|nr:MAG: hypothetical protein CM1200mP24_00840 [Gammaproteobacteria bacterium]
MQSVSDALHDELFEEAQALYSMHAQAKDKRTGLHLIADNLTARSRLLREIVDAPEVGGALGAILGQITTDTVTLLSINQTHRTKHFTKILPIRGAFGPDYDLIDPTGP